MTTPNPLPLEDVLDLFVAEIETPTRNAALAFARRFPAYRREIIDFSVRWAEQELLLPAGPLTEGAEASLRSRMQSYVQNQLHAKRSASVASADAAAPIAVRVGVSLNSLVVAAGKSLHDLSRACGLDLIITRKLNSRQIRSATIPRALSRRIADFIGVSLEQVLAAWIGPPRLAKASFLSVGKPEALRQEDFADAVANSSLAEDERTLLLADDL